MKERMRIAWSSSVQMCITKRTAEHGYKKMDEKEAEEKKEHKNKRVCRKLVDLY